MSVDEYSKFFKTPLRPEVQYAAELLEGRGYRLMIDFGTTNAVTKATGMILEDIEIEERYGHGV